MWRDRGWEAVSWCASNLVFHLLCCELFAWSQYLSFFAVALLMILYRLSGMSLMVTPWLKHSKSRRRQRLTTTAVRLQHGRKTESNAASKSLFLSCLWIVSSLRRVFQRCGSMHDSQAEEAKLLNTILARIWNDKGVLARSLTSMNQQSQMLICDLIESTKCAP